MAVITEIESDDELPPLVQSGSATSQKGAPAKERLTQIPRQAVPVNDESDDEDDDELPPLISSTGKVDEAPKKEVPPPAKMPEAKASPAARGLGAGNRQQIEPPVAAKADAAKAVAAKADVAKADAKEADDKVLSRDDLDDAIEVLEDGHYEDAEFLAGEARSQAASEGDAAREADALRVVTKAQIKEAESQGFDAPDSNVLEKALKAASSEAFAFEKSGQFVAKAIMQLASAEIFLAMDSHAEALPMAQQALSTLEQADASRERKGMAYRSLVDIYLAQGRHSLVAITTERVKEHILKPSTRQEARELAGALLSCAKARVAASEAVAAVEAAEQAGALFERMGDARQTALAACEEAKAYNLMKGSQIAARRTASRALALARETCDSKIEAEACLCSCMAYVNAQQGPEALKAGKQALSLAREVRDIEMIGQAIQALMQISGQEKASQIAEEELMMAKKVGDRRREANAQQKMAAAMALQDRPREAIRRGTEAMEQLRQVGDLKGEAKAAQMLVELQCQGKRMMEAKRSAKDAQRIFKEIGDPKGCVGVLQYLTSVFLEAGEQHEAIQAARDQVKVFREAGFKEEEASATLGLAEMTQQTMGPRDALRLCKDAASMFQSVGDIGGEARALAQCTQLHVALKSNSTASETAKQAEDLARRSGDAKILSTTLQACAEAYTNSERFTEALDLAKEALQLAEKAAVKDEAGRASALACLASVHLQTGHHDVNHPGIRSRPRGLKEAVKISEEALAIHRKLNDHSGEIGGVQRIFHAHLLGQDGPNALRYAREYMELAQRSVQKDNLGPALVSLCQAHFLCRNYEEAERANLEARAIFEKARSRENLEICDQIMSELKQEVERTQRPTQPMGKANTTQGAGFGYNSLLPERQVRSQGNGVPVGGFGGSESTAGADALRRGSEGGAASTARKSERSNDPSAKGFSEGLRGAFSRQSQSSQSSKPPAASPTPAPAPAPAASPAPRTTSSSFRSSAASSGGREGRSGLGERYGSSRSSYSSSYTNGGGYSNVANGHSTSSRGGYGSYSQPQRGVPAGGFGGRGVPAGGFGGAVATPASAPDERPRGATSRPGAFAGFAGRGLGRGEE